MPASDTCCGRMSHTAPQGPMSVMTLPHLKVRKFDAPRAEALQSAVEARVALSRTGFEKLAGVMDGKRAQKVRTDVYFEAWDGKRFLLATAARPWKLRLMRKEKDGK